MSVVLTRSPLEPIGMNGAEARTRRSARLSQEGGGENEPVGKKVASQSATTTTTTVSTKQGDGGTKPSGVKKRKVYEQEVEGFSFSRGKRSKASEKQTPPEPVATKADTTNPAPSVRADKVRAEIPRADTAQESNQVLADEAAPKTAQKKTRRKLPTTPEHEAVGRTVRRSKRLSDERPQDTSPTRTTHSRKHNHADRSPSPERARPVTVEKKRMENGTKVVEEKVLKIVLPFADTPIICRNKEMRKRSGDGHRRSSSGMRGKRASSMMDEGRGHALPHSEVPAAEFYKHISAELTEPRRMRCLLGWCGTRALPATPDVPAEDNTPSSLETRASQTARIIQEELSQDLISKGILSDWFSRDESAPPPVPLRKKANPRNTINAKKAEEMEMELARLKAERAEWDNLLQFVDSTHSPPGSTRDMPDGGLSPLRPNLLDSPQRDILTQLQSSDASGPVSCDPAHITRRLKDVSENLEFTVDSFAHGVHALRTMRDTAERVAERSLASAAEILDEREKRRGALGGKAVEQIDILRGLARVLNAQYKGA